MKPKVLIRPVVAACLLSYACVACEDHDRSTGARTDAGRAAAGDATVGRDDERDDERARDPAGDRSPQARQRRGDPDCARIETRTRSVAGVGGGPMQMVMVTECVPARR